MIRFLRRTFSKHALFDLPSHASRFQARHRKLLNVNIKDAKSEDEMFSQLPTGIVIDNYFMIEGLTRDELSVIDHQPHIKQKIKSREGRTLASYLNQVIKNDPLKTGIKETLTDSFVNYILARLEFNEEPFLMNMQSKCRFPVGGKFVTAVIEFTIEKNNTILCFDEDKHFHGHTVSYAYEYGESQIAAEILACAYTNFDRGEYRGKDHTVFAMRIIGSRFTFYKAFVSAEYCKSISNGLPPSDKTVYILRYPPNNDKDLYGYDYADNQLRPKIIELLFRLREHIKRM